MESVMSRRNTLTPSAIDALRQGSLIDEMTPGLALEVLPSGKKSWKYARRVSGSKQLLRWKLGYFPAFSIADARKWASEINEQVEKGIDPREVLRAEQKRAQMTVRRAHELYMEAVLDGRASRAKRKNKPRTIRDKRKMFNADIAPKLGDRSIYEVTEEDLIRLVNDKGKGAKVRANRLAAELKVFFGWAAGLRGKEVGLASDPSLRLGDLKFPENPRTRKLSHEEIAWYLKGVALEKSSTIRRGLILLLLTAARISEVVLARSDEFVDGVWTIPIERSKNHAAHTIKLGPWGQSLMASDSQWVFKADKSDGPRKTGWYEARDRVHKRMIEYAGKHIERFCPHDLRRTARSNTKRLKVDFETAEAMLNHLKTGMERIYDGYELEEEKAAWFLKWECEIIQIAREHGLTQRLGIADPVRVITSSLCSDKAFELWPQKKGEAGPTNISFELYHPTLGRALTQMGMVSSSLSLPAGIITIASRAEHSSS